MAKADDKSSTTDKIFLFKALVLATARLGTEALAKRRLREWLKSGQLPWSSRDWYGPDAETIAKLARENAENKYVGYYDPSGPYRQGDPEFWAAPTLDIKWQENRAGEAARGGAVAEGIWVTYSRLLELLPEKLRKREKTPGSSHEREETPEPIKPARDLQRKRGPEEWLAWALKVYPRQRSERYKTDHIRRLHGLMQEAGNVTKAWKLGTFTRNYYRAVKTDR